MRPTRNSATEEDELFSPATDLIISLLAVLLVLIFIGTKMYHDTLLEKDNLHKKIGEIKELLNREQEDKKKSSEKYAELEKQLRETKKNIFPPNVIIEGAGKYAFPSGKAELSKELKVFIRNELVDKIEENIEQYDINVIEVIGHTDSQAVSSSSSNLDKILEDVANGDIPIKKLSANSNADLGLMRALSVVKELQNIKKQKQCIEKPQQKGCLSKLNDKIGFRVYSAAQLISPSGEFAKTNLEEDAEERRRIEIRFTRFRPNENFRN